MMGRGGVHHITTWRHGRLGAIFFSSSTGLPRGSKELGARRGLGLGCRRLCWIGRSGNGFACRCWRGIRRASGREICRRGRSVRRLGGGGLGPGWCSYAGRLRCGRNISGLGYARNGLGGYARNGLGSGSGMRGGYARSRLGGLGSGIRLSRSRVRGSSRRGGGLCQF